MLLIGLIFIITFCLCMRMIYLLYFKTRNIKPANRKNVRTCVVLGSGGHTAEMIRQIEKLPLQFYNPRVYIMALNDTSSESKILSIESKSNYHIKKVFRSRNVNQSYVSSVFTTVYSIVTSIPFMLVFRPQLILCNGPGTCIPICLIAYVMNVLFVTDCKIIFFESICRVKTLSLTGKILLYFADEVLVQWPRLHEKYPKTKYIGHLM